MGQSPILKGGNLGCFCVYVSGCRGISAPLFSPPKTPGSHLLGGWKGFAQVFINNHTKSMVGKVLLKILLIITPEARGILVIFRVKH